MYQRRKLERRRALFLLLFLSPQIKPILCILILYCPIERDLLCASTCQVFQPNLSVIVIVVTVVDTKNSNYESMTAAYIVYLALELHSVI